MPLGCTAWTDTVISPRGCSAAGRWRCRQSHGWHRWSGKLIFGVTKNRRRTDIDGVVLPKLVFACLLDWVDSSRITSGYRPRDKPAGRRLATSCSRFKYTASTPVCRRRRFGFRWPKYASSFLTRMACDSHPLSREAAPPARDNFSRSACFKYSDYVLL